MFQYQIRTAFSIFQNFLPIATLALVLTFPLTNPIQSKRLRAQSHVKEMWAPFTAKSLLSFLITILSAAAIARSVVTAPTFSRVASKYT